jgi:Helicase conserved C-terminal domain
MLEAVIQDLIRQQRPYYLPQGSSIKGVGGQYWLVFRHRDADKGGNFLKNIVPLLGIKDQAVPHKVLRIDPNTAKIYTYNPRQAGDLPSPALLRTSNLKVIEKFLTLERTTKEPALLRGSFREIKGIKRRYTLPTQLEPYNKVMDQMLERSSIYRRSTAYFDSGVLKLYEEPLQTIVQTEGQIRLLMDWQGFTKRADVAELEKLHNPDYRTQFIQRTLQEFLQGLEANAFNGTQILAELVRLGFLEIKLVKMSQQRSLYHKKTGIFSDRLDNHILHEGSDNVTRAAHSRNAESVTFLYSWEQLDQETIEQSIQEFDSEWQRQDLAYDLTQEFLEQVLQEYDRRAQQRQPRIEQITPDELPPGETTEVKITGDNLDQVESITIPDNTLLEVAITEQTRAEITADFIVSPDHPPQPITDFRVRDSAGGEYNIQPQKPPQVSQVEELPNFDEIEGFQQAVELILSGQHGTPNDFLYWLAQQRPRQFRVDLVNQGTLFEHQKSGAQHCLRVMQDFGISVCADAVGLGKTRLAATVSWLYRQSFEIEQRGQAKIAIIAARKLHQNWEREMKELGFRGENLDYELYNKNLMSRKGNGFIDDFNRYGGPDLVIIDEAHEGIRNYKNRIHKLCLQIRERDRASGRQRHFLLLTATPWNNRREDIYNILQPFLTRPEGFTEAGFPVEVAQWFQNRETGVEQFTDDSTLFRRTYRELFLQRTRQMLRDAMPDLNVYAKRQAEWLPVQFEASTEAALEQIFTQFETQLYIPFADPVRYLTGSVEQRSLLQNQRRFFLQRAESSMYALRRTIVNFRGRIEQMQSRLGSVTPDADGLKQFILLHYGFESEQPEQLDFGALDDREAWDEDYEEDEDDEEETVVEQQEKRQQLRRTIDLAIGRLQADPVEARRVYNLMWSACDNDLMQLQEIQDLLADEFVKDHKREQVTLQVRELVSQGKKVLLISIFSDTVIDYYRYMTQDAPISRCGIGMAIGSTKRYYPSPSDRSIQVAPHNTLRSGRQRTGIKRQELFRLFAPVATCKTAAERPSSDEEVMVLIGSETLSVGQNLQDADYLINIDLPWNPMTLEQRIGRIDRPKQHACETLYIYYANSESQLLRQASRLANLNKKLIGENLTGQDGVIQSVPNMDDLGASIYGDTLFDDTILPGYVNFIRNLVVARRQTQESFQETLYRQQETSRDLYTQQEIVFSEDISQRLQAMGDDYQANPIALGRKTGEKDEPTGLVALTVRYFGPNGEVISDRQELLFWNDQTGERDGYGMALSTAVKTPEAGDVFSARYLRTSAQKLYSQLVELKQQRSSSLLQPETLENVTTTSERLNKIQQRISSLNSLPDGLERKMVKDTLKKLNAWKGIKSIQKLLRDYTDGAKAQLETSCFVAELVKDTDEKNLILSDGIKPTALTISLSAMLLRA